VSDNPIPPEPSLTESDDTRMARLVVMLIVIVLHAARPFVSHAVNMFFVGLPVLLTVYSALRHWHAPLHLSLLYSLIGISWLFPEVLATIWSPYPLALTLYLILAWLIKPLRQTAYWLRVGSLTHNTIWWIVAVVTISSISLLIWHLIVRPDVSSTVQLLPTSNAVAVIGAVVGAAIINAIVEEFIFDGVCYWGFETVIAVPVIVILLQAFSYGMARYVGIPRGWPGVAMAIAYGGLMLGYLRYRTGGVLYPIVAHVFADVTIGLLVFFV
jgi:uncharacterized protein